uniref:Uncharacterized protein n=1 Tax=Lactuca sativa TaxID=4236 RepID=A0A9R1WU06_LACSA|nr:hypothetical protein LSAT_V11C800448960 [Lactuca sativa]
MKSVRITDLTGPSTTFPNLQNQTRVSKRSMHLIMEVICRYFFQAAAKIMMKKKKGTTMASLMHMQKILSNRVQHFPTLKKAIEWNVRSGPLRNIDSAQISIPRTVNYRHRARLEETKQY